MNSTLMRTSAPAPALALAVPSRDRLVRVVGVDVPAPQETTALRGAWVGAYAGTAGLGTPFTADAKAARPIAAQLLAAQHTAPSALRATSLVVDAVDAARQGPPSRGTPV